MSKKQEEIQKMTSEELEEHIRKEKAEKEESRQTLLILLALCTGGILTFLLGYFSHVTVWKIWHREDSFEQFKQIYSPQVNPQFAVIWLLLGLFEIGILLCLVYGVYSIVEGCKGIYFKRAVIREYRNRQNEERKKENGKSHCNL